MTHHATHAGALLSGGRPALTAKNSCPSIGPFLYSAALQQFRAEWRADIQQNQKRKQRGSHAGPGGSSTSSGAAGESRLSEKEQHALALYTDAVYHEGEGSLNEGVSDRTRMIRSPSSVRDCATYPSACASGIVLLLSCSLASAPAAAVSLRCPLPASSAHHDLLCGTAALALYRKAFALYRHVDRLYWHQFQTHGEVRSHRHDAEEPENAKEMDVEAIASMLLRSALALDACRKLGNEYGEG